MGGAKFGEARYLNILHYKYINKKYKYLNKNIMILKL